MEVSFIRVFLLRRRAVPAAWHSRLSVSVLRSLASFSSLLLSRNGERAYHCRQWGRTGTVKTPNMRSDNKRC